MNRRLQLHFPFGFKPVRLLVIAAAFAGVALAQAADAAFELQSGIVIDKDSGIAFVMSTKGGSDALDIASGEVLWHSSRAGRPLAVIDDHMVAQVESAQAGSLEIAIIEALSGNLLKMATTTLPADTVARVGNGMGSSFRSWAEVQGGQLAIGWEASMQQIRGNGSGPLQRATNAALLDVSSGMLAPTTAIPARPQRDKEIQSSNRLAAASGRQFLSSDGQHVLASELLNDRWGYRWTLFTRDGAPVGEIESPVSYAPFFVAGTSIVYPLQPSVRQESNQLIQFPLRLRAVDLDSGAELWTREIRDTTFRGPYPP